MIWTRILAAGCCAAIFAIPASPQTAQLNAKDKEFLKMAAVSDMVEAHMGQMAEKKAAMPGIKNFAQTVVKDQTDAYQELAVLSNKLGENIPKGINVRRNRQVTMLTALKGRKFDGQFLRDEVRDDQRRLDAYKSEAAHGQDADVKAYANHLLPAMEEHLRQAEKLLKNPA